MNWAEEIQQQFKTIGDLKDFIEKKREERKNELCYLYKLDRRI